MPIYTTPLDFDCISVSAQSFTACLPIRVNCDIIETDDWYNEEGDEWNNNLCQTDICYFIPFAQGDKVQFQTRFFDPARENPTNYDTLVLVEVLSEGGAVLIDNANSLAERKMSAWNGRNNYQIIEFQLESLDECFKLRFTSGEKTIVTNSFQLLKPCRNTFVLRSEFSKMDCFGYSYGEPEEHTDDLILYDNSLRYYASIKMDGDQINKERLGKKVLSGEIVNNWRIILNKMIPPFMKKIMTNQHLAGERVYIDNVEYNFDQIAIEPEDTKNNMHFFEIRPTKSCQINYRC
jgi:hypothetical protein